MTQQSPNQQPGWDPRGWGTSKILLLLAAVAVFVVMLTWDRGHFSSEQPTATKQIK